MTYRLRVLLALIVTSIGAPAFAAEEGTKRPNVLLLLADDLGWGDVGFNGRTEWATPHLDRLATRGTTFKRFYTAAVVCAPSRAALMTGKYTIHNGVSRNNDDLPAREVTLAEAFKTQGYDTALFGKWHHGQPRDGGKTYVHPMDQGFDEFFGFTDAKHAWEKYPETLWHGRELKPVSGYSDDMFADHAIDFLKRHKEKATPFFLYVPFINTHFNIEAPAEEVALHKGKFTEADPSKPIRATYAAMVTQLDKNVGRIITALEGLGLAGDTLVVFVSDHGATFESGNLGASDYHDSNRPFRGQKRTLWEGGIRVPGIACWPGHVPAGVVSNEVVHMTDLFPTLLAATGAHPEPAWQVDGADLWSTWTGKAKSPERTLFWEWRVEGANQLAAMRGAMKLVITSAGRPELFNVETDPAERRNAIAEYPELARQLQNELKTWLATETKD
ncbi:Arylsulfatase A [Singulisphaera sp. GP187]|uniref:sulfatase family protein n=1 Tax=Singulisphaera sp. GP187 TaxID=1882752 RepID=UPI00092714C7|nr:sulfatase-like hydrolase/transferase [Singulisphaera sp. GP187]SIO44333.1 Arylsulfatase A [Singulisphaera sp. GP187]